MYINMYTDMYTHSYSQLCGLSRLLWLEMSPIYENMKICASIDISRESRLLWLEMYIFSYMGDIFLNLDC